MAVVVATVRREWDVIVVGAGPAGSLAARELAHRGLAVLLVDKARFPRRKVCGGCVSAAALSVLQAAGLGALPARCGASRLTRWQLRSGRYQATVRLPDGAAISRAALDTALVEAATASGVHWVSETAATLGGTDGAWRAVGLRSPDGRDTTTLARVVLVSDGLMGTSLQRPASFRQNVSRHSRLGVATVIPTSPTWCEPGAIMMVCGQGGYAGFVRLEEGQLGVAAALDPAYLRDCRRAGAAIERLARAAGWPAIPGVHEAAWQGTPLMMGAPRPLAAPRMFVLGDAAGYVEPFTGEGMAWALAGAMAVIPLAEDAVAAWHPALSARWIQTYRRVVVRRQRVCRMSRVILRRPCWSHGAVRVLARAPWLATPLVRTVTRPFA